MGCPLWVQSRISVLHHYRTLTTDTPWLAREGNTWGVLCELKFLSMYFITKGSSQQKPKMARPSGQYMGCPLWVQILVDLLHHYRFLKTDTPWVARKDDSWGAPCEFKLWLLMYYINTDHFFSYLSTQLFFSCDSVLDMFNFMDFL